MSIEKLTTILLLLVCFSGCIREELPVPAFDRGDAKQFQVRMGNDYQHQIWFRLSDGEIVSQNEKIAWDLAFDCREDSLWIYLNSSLAMQAARTGKKNLEEVSSKTGLTFRPDISSGTIDSNAIGRWWEHGEVIVIDRGYNVQGQQLGFIKMRIISADTEKYEIEYAKLNGQNYQRIVVNRESSLNRVMFNLDAAQQVDIEPENSDWDLLFSSYTYQFYDPFLAYLVTGVIVHPETEVAIEKDKSFDEITFADAENYSFSNAADAIGYEWKEYDFDTGLFKIFPEFIYIIKDSKGFYYKLYFTDFYDDGGQKGNPTFIYQKL
jgi:hypothetical protein